MRICQKCSIADVSRSKLKINRPIDRSIVLKFHIYVYEDDLWSSVKDGRYEEQKFRMKSSGLTHLYYLIEDFSVQKQNWGQVNSDKNEDNIFYFIRFWSCLSSWLYLP